MGFLVRRLPAVVCLFACDIWCSFIRARKRTRPPASPRSFSLRFFLSRAAHASTKGRRRGACARGTKRDLDFAAHLLTPPKPTLGLRPIAVVFGASLAAHYRRLRAERRRRAHKQQSERRARQNDHPTALCHCAVLRSTRRHRVVLPIPTHPARRRHLFCSMIITHSS